jgi:hypothetical protein
LVENDTLKAFAFDIDLPDESSSRFHIFHDLAELFGEEFNSDALKRLRKLLREHPNDPKRKLSSDHEADCVSLSATQADVIFLAARLINENSIPQYARDYSVTQYQDICQDLNDWKRRKPHKWKVGDVFCFPLSDGEYGYGQVLTQWSTCALLDIKSRSALPLSEFEASRESVAKRLTRKLLAVFRAFGRLRKTFKCGARVISALHVGSDLLDKGQWKILGNQDLMANPQSSTQGRERTDVGAISFGGGATLQDLAEAYHGLKPWNVGWSGDDEYFDKMLLTGIERPERAQMLDAEQRSAYRHEHGFGAL